VALRDPTLLRRRNDPLASKLFFDAIAVLHPNRYGDDRLRQPKFSDNLVQPVHQGLGRVVAPQISTAFDQAA
jgi:hypothetical protein